MTEEKDDFLREIDELLQGDLEIDSEPSQPTKTESTSVGNVSNGVADLDLNSLDSGSNLNPTGEPDANHVISEPPQPKASPPPKTG